VARPAFSTIAIAIVLSSAALLAPPAGAASSDQLTWTTQFVGKAGRADDFALTRSFIDLGPSGRSVILYSSGPNDEQGFDLRLARGPFADGSFHRRHVDPADTKITGYPSLAVSPRGRAHVSYVSGIFLDQGVLKYAVRGRTGWTREVADPVQSVGQTAITLDPHHQPVIAYTRVNNGLRLATRSAAGWVTSPVSDERVVALDVAINPAGHPEIAYVAWDGSDYVARLATWDGSAWSFETVGLVSSEGIEFGIDLLIDTDGREDLVFPVFEPVQGLTAAHRTATGWTLDLISAGDLWQPTPAYGPDGDLNVVFYNATDGALRYAHRIDGRWKLQTVADNPSPGVRIGRLSSIVMDDQGRAHVSYYVGKETSGTTIRYAVSAPG
jgi:hypothetical protein